MTITIPTDFWFFFVPALVIFLFTRTLSSQKTGGGFFPATSDRDEFWIIGFPLWLIISLTSWGIWARFFA